VTAEYVQQNQPDGVPPLALTGERTLPDVPEENYWFQRHLVVYRYVAAEVAGQKVVDVAAGEGYGADVLAGRAREVVGIEPNPDAFEHARARYRRANLTFRRDLAETFAEPGADAITFLQTIEHVPDADAVLAHFAAQAPVAYVSTPNVLTLAPPGAERSGNPWHVHEYRLEEFRALCARHFAHVEVLGLRHARMLRIHQVAIERLGWDAIHARLRITGPFYDRFVPAISVRDFALGPADDRALDFLAVCRR
jgi:hypothetical protein